MAGLSFGFPPVSYHLTTSQTLATSLTALMRPRLGQKRDEQTITPTSNMQAHTDITAKRSFDVLFRSAGEDDILALYAFESWRNFIERVLGWEPSALLTVHFQNHPPDVESARTFAVAALEHHDGGAVDHRVSHVWTHEQVRDQTMVNGRRFLDGI